MQCNYKVLKLEYFYRMPMFTSLNNKTAMITTFNAEAIMPTQ